MTSRSVCRLVRRFVEARVMPARCPTYLDPISKNSDREAYHFI
jgi:hypothetical protein